MRLIISGLFFMLSFATLIYLGAWQLERLSWKNDVIAKLNAAYATPDKEITFDALNALNQNDITYGTMRGRFIYEKEILVGPKPNEGDIGYQVITPLKVASGGHVLVNRGWIAESEKDARQETQVPGTLNVTGLFRVPDWNSFTSNNSPENNIWMKLDVAQIAKAQGIDPVAPQMLYAAATSKSFGHLRLQSTQWLPRNKHKQYAIFWFTMAGVLVGIFGFFVYQRQ